MRLKERFFQPDKYNDRKAASCWLKFQFPFWWPNLLTALDTLSWLHFTRQDGDIARGLDWFLANQSADGLWEIGYGSGKNIHTAIQRPFGLTTPLYTTCPSIAITRPGTRPVTV